MILQAYVSNVFGLHTGRRTAVPAHVPLPRLRCGFRTLHHLQSNLLKAHQLEAQTVNSACIWMC
jgi:hypothetical protein